MTPPRPASAWLDWMAIGASGLCLVHCLALPLIVAFLPALGLAGGDRTHWLLLAFAVPTSLWALGRGRNRATAPLLIASGGLLLMTVAVVRFEGQAADRWLTVAGVLLVAAAHILRWRLIHRGHGHGFAGRNPVCTPD
ncbi:MAG: MerC domain-containing protein [Janthinobacterium lividum]